MRAMHSFLIRKCVHKLLGVYAHNGGCVGGDLSPAQIAYMPILQSIWGREGWLARLMEGGGGVVSPTIWYREVSVPYSS